MLGYVRHFPPLRALVYLIWKRYCVNLLSSQVARHFGSKTCAVSSSVLSTAYSLYVVAFWVHCLCMRTNGYFQANDLEALRFDGVRQPYPNPFRLAYTRLNLRHPMLKKPRPPRDFKLEAKLRQMYPHGVGLRGNFGIFHFK